MDHNSSTSSSSRRRWWAYAITVTTTWLVFAFFGQIIADLAEAKLGPQILSATKGRIFDPNQFVHDRLYDIAYLISIGILATAAIEAVVYGLGRVMHERWRFVPVAAMSFVILNGAVLLASRSASFWLPSTILASSMRLANAKLSEQILWQNAKGRTGMVLGSSQANAQLGVEYLNKILEEDTLFAEQSYCAGHPMNVLMLQDGWQKHPDVAIWYLSILDIYNHIELGSAAQPLMTATTQKDVMELQGDEAMGRLRMRYAKLGRTIPMFRIRRTSEFALFGTTGVPRITNRNRTMDAEAERARQRARMIEVLTVGTDPPTYETACQFQRGCIRRVVQRFDEHGTKLVVITGHVHPEVESQMPEKRAELLRLLREMESQSNNVFVIDNELPRPTADEYRDFTHLDDSKRFEYTSKVVELLKEKNLL